jgi:hypothetical protein
MINAMILNAKLSFNLWGEALLTAYHVHNRIPSKKFKVSPYKLWKDRKPNLGYLWVCGCLAFYRVTDPKGTKLGPRAVKSVLVGYAENSKAYRLLDFDSNVIMESKDVEFIEDKFYNDSKLVANPTPTQENDLNDLNPSISREKGKEYMIYRLNLGEVKEFGKKRIWVQILCHLKLLFFLWKEIETMFLTKFSFY